MLYQVLDLISVFVYCILQIAVWSYLFAIRHCKALMNIILLSHGFLSVLLTVYHPVSSAYIITRSGCRTLLGELSLPYRSSPTLYGVRRYS